MVVRGAKEGSLLCFNVDLYCFNFLVLDEVLSCLQDFCWILPKREQVSMTCKYCDKFFKINCGLFAKKTQPMTFSKAYDLARNMLREAGHKSDPLMNEEMTQFLVPNKNPKGPRRQGAQGPPGGQQNERKRFPTKTKSGEELCLPFNSYLGCSGWVEPQDVAMGLLPLICPLLHHIRLCLLHVDQLGIIASFIKGILVIPNFFIELFISSARVP